MVTAAFANRREAPTTAETSLVRTAFWRLSPPAPTGKIRIRLPSPFKTPIPAPAVPPTRDPWSPPHRRGGGRGDEAGGRRGCGRERGATPGRDGGAAVAARPFSFRGR